MSEELRVVEGRYGPRAVLISEWSSEVESAIRAQGCVELEINYAHGWRGSSIDFLERLPWLRALTVVDWNLQSVGPVHALHSLRSLELMTYCDTAMDFSVFPELEACALEWRPGSESLFGRDTLRTLFINRFDGRDLKQVAALVRLEELSILNAPLVTLEGIEKLSGLRRLRLGNLPKLASLAGVEGLAQLVELDVNTCRSVRSISPVQSLQFLRRLFINDCGPIDSLGPIRGLPALEEVVFYGTTRILDGDLAPLTTLDHIRKVSFQDRRSYSHRREDIPVLCKT